MNTNKITDIESYFKTENEHFNSFTFKMICEALKMDFENIETPLSLFDIAINTFLELHDSPLKAIQTFQKEIEKEKLTFSQKQFVLNYVFNYLKSSEFDNDLTQIKELLKISIQNLNKEAPEKPLVKNMREVLKGILNNEIEALPETLKSLDAEKRINIVCKLAPFILPKVEIVHSKEDEPSQF